MGDKAMPFEEAFEIVYGLAKQAMVSCDDAETPELQAECERQQEALDIVYKFVADSLLAGGLPHPKVEKGEV